MKLAQNRLVVTTPYGFLFTGNPQMESGLFEPVETLIIRALLPHFEYFVNIGANIGYYCCHALQMNVPTIAFEPSYGNLSLLLKNISINSWQKSIEVFPIALSEKTGILNFYGEGTGASLVPGWAGVPNNYFSLVPVSTLDLVLGSRKLDRKNLFLIDVEGSELPMLRGAVNHLDHSHGSVWMIEISICEHLPKGQSVNPFLKETFEIFWTRGFTAYTADGKARVITEKIIDQMINDGSDNISTHNFIFCPAGLKQEIINSIKLVN